MYVITLDDAVYKAKSMSDVPKAFMSIKEDTITDEFGDGSKSFLSDAAGRNAPAAIAIIHADSVEEALKTRDNYYAQRLERKNIIFGSIWEIIN